MLSERPMDWTHRLFNRARSSRVRNIFKQDAGLREVHQYDLV